jgi:cytochrome P450
MRRRITDPDVSPSLPKSRLETNFALSDSFAGSDTTSTTIRVLMMHIISHFQVQQRLLQECLSVNLPLTEIISDKRAKELPYLQACIKESLRVFPSAAGLMLKDAPPGGDTLPDGTFIPGGTAIGHCSWAIHRNKAIYGPDAHLFRPERWLEAKGERLAKMERTQLNVFGHGLYRCLGENIAKLELNKVIFELVRRFEITLEDPAKPFERNTSYGLFLQTGMWVRIEEREVEIS